MSKKLWKLRKTKRSFLVKSRLEYVPLLVQAPVNSFELQICYHTLQAECLTLLCTELNFSCMFYLGALCILYLLAIYGWSIRLFHWDFHTIPCIHGKKFLNELFHTYILPLYLRIRAHVSPSRKPNTGKPMMYHKLPNTKHWAEVYPLVQSTCICYVHTYMWVVQMYLGPPAPPSDITALESPTLATSRRSPTTIAVEAVEPASWLWVVEACKYSKSVFLKVSSVNTKFNINNYIENANLTMSRRKWVKNASNLLQCGCQ